ncbi:MAG: hypothetical protein AB1633_08480, partial [Elusimicrobiota bacterium]
MAGSKEKLKMVSRQVLFLCLVTLFAQPGMAGGKRADFLILENPLSYSILNKYEQPLSTEEKRQFVPYTPLQVVNEDQTLRDRITRAFKFLFLKTHYYILKDETGRWMGKDTSGFKEKFNDCFLLEDSVKILKGNKVKFCSAYPSSGKCVMLNKGEKLIRIFQHGKHCYAKREWNVVAYGWCPMSSEIAWERLIEAKAPEEKITLSVEIKDRLIQ